MSMQCSSVFPRCASPQSRDELVPAGGRVPLCLHLCILPLVACPGFWIGDIAGPCSMVSVPPMCTQAFYWNAAGRSNARSMRGALHSRAGEERLPPQYSSFDEANPFPSECPKNDPGPTGMDSAEDPALYDDGAPLQSPILGDTPVDTVAPTR